MADREFDVVIVGAGLSGLGAADALNQTNTLRAIQGKAALTYVVLEGRDVVGGRVQTANPEYGWLDLGGAYITLTQRYVQQLVARFKLPTITSLIADQGTRWKFQLEDGSVLTLDSGSDAANFPGKQDTEALLGVLDSMTCDMRASLDDPGKALNATRYDSWTAADFVAHYAEISGAKMNDRTRQAFNVAVRSAFSVEPEELSFLFMVYYAARTGSFAMLADILSGPLSAEGTRLVHGAGQLVECLAREVPQGCLKTGEEVTGIDRTSTTEVVVTSTSGTWRCKDVIVAVSPTIAGKIAYTPPLDATPAETLRTTLTSNMKMGRTIKSFLIYKRPWWREQGFSGNTMSTHLDIGRYPMDWALDNVWDPPVRDADLPYPKHTASLMTFIVGKAADLWHGRTPAERRDALVAQLVEIYGGPEARDELVDYVEHDYRDVALAGGCPTGVLGPNVLSTAFSALRAPIGRIHWAGTESATDWCGYMDGALQSGMRAALEVQSAQEG